MDSSGQQNGFLYDGTTYATLDAPLGTNGTYAQGISGSCIVGYYEDSSDLDHGFLYNGSTSTYTTLDDPLASPDGKVNGTRAYGISGSNIVGAYLDPAVSKTVFSITAPHTRRWTTRWEPMAPMPKESAAI